ncbi:MAG: thiamine pyrophosphate-binding protein [Patescibacteria group bacterium]|jgi:acetolactate synthase-1/2/3 large subunit
MKSSEYVIKFLEKITDSVFFLPGGGIMHLVDSLGRSKKIDAYCTHHEQAAATAAEGYARIKNDIGVILVTSGPGATNAITGVAGAWLDSIPLLIISGQVKTDNITPRKNGKPTVRAIGFQELNVIDLVKPITKYAVTVEKKEDIKYHLEKAVSIAKTGRPGPVWIEIPLDIQGAKIDVNKLRSYHPLSEAKYKIPMDLIIEKLKKAKKPLLMVGNGIRLAGGEKTLLKILNKFKINTVSALYTADDLVPSNYSHYLGRQGMWGNTTANWAVDNCDLLLVIGERLQLTQLSYDYQNFATQAFKIMIDIDENELHKKTLDIDLPIHADAKIFLDVLIKQKIKLNRWNVKIKPTNLNLYSTSERYVNVYNFLEELNNNLNKQNIITSDAMAAVASHQVLKIKSGQRFIVNAGLGQMGQGLPMAIGACIASGMKPTICIEGDGSIMLNIHELQTIQHHNLPIKIFILNNGGYYSIKNTHIDYFKKEFASSPQTGVSFPEYKKLIPAWGFKYLKIHNDQELYKIRKVMDNKYPIVCELMINPEQLMFSKWTAGKYKNNSNL